MCYERHPESMRTVPWLRPAGRDSAPAPCPNRAVFRQGKRCFNLPQHSPKSRRTIGNSHPTTLSRVEMLILRWDLGGWFGLQHDPCGSLFKSISTFGGIWDLGLLAGWLGLFAGWLGLLAGWPQHLLRPARPDCWLAGRGYLGSYWQRAKKKLATGEQEIGNT